MTTVIKVENLSKQYRLGVINAHTLRDDVQRWWHKVRGKEDPLARVDGHAALESQVSSLKSQASKALPRDVLWALRDVSFEVGQGEALGIIGRNGAGKSTLLKLLSRVTAPTTGRIKVKGRIASLLEVGTGFHPELTGRENIFLNGAILGMTRDEVRSKLDEIISFAEVERFIDTPVKRYSSGMYVRLAFAVAAHLEPEILIVDEVLAVGDVNFQRKCLGKMSDVANQGRTVLFVSHNMGAIKGLTRNAIWLDRGEIKHAGPKDETVLAYLNSAVGPSSWRVSMENEPRKAHMGERARIEFIEINQGLPVQHGEPFTLRLVINAMAAIPSVAAGIGFCNMDGTRILTVDSDLVGMYWDVAKGAFAIESTIPRCDLQPSSYLIDSSIRSGDGGYLDSINSCARLDVVPGPRTPSVIVRTDSGLRLPAEWKGELAR